jgi:cyclase
MLSVRVIPTLLLKSSGLVKGSQFANYKYVGDPINAVKILNDKEVDELVFLDITATDDGRPPNFNLLKDIASQAFMPFGYGGGIRTIEDIEAIFRLGVEKVIINTAAYNDISIIKSASALAGSQSIVISIDVHKNTFGKYQVFVHSGKMNTKQDPVEYAKKVEAAGAGEILLCNIDREGTGQGYDLDLIHNVVSAVNIPVVASGGAGSLDDFRKAYDGGASAVAAGDMFIFYGKHKAVLITYPKYDEITRIFKEGWQKNGK